MIISVSLFRAFLPPFFPYRDTKSVWMAFVMHARQKPKYKRGYSLLLQMQSFHPCFHLNMVSSRLEGSPLCTGVCRRLHEYLRPRHEYGDLRKKKELIGLAEFQHVDGRSSRRECHMQDSVLTRCQSGTPSICKQCGLQFPIRPPTSRNQRAQTHRCYFPLIKSDRG